MPDSYDLTKLDPYSFEHLANFLAIKVLGAGHSTFSPGPDAGRDGYFEGEAPYPSEVDRWSGRWYLQSKFHRPHLTKDSQKWLVEQVADELKLFRQSTSRRHWPDNWIIVTNVDPSGVAETGAFDKCRKLVREANPGLANHFHIWGGRKVLQLLALHPEIAEYYAHFITPGHVLRRLYDNIGDLHAGIETVVRHLVVTQFGEQQHTKLEQAGSTSDSRPGIHSLFTDLPFVSAEGRGTGHAAKTLSKSLAQVHTPQTEITGGSDWRAWQRVPSRARIWFIKGGPGQGKSTITQYISQIQRAALILSDAAPKTTPQQREIAAEIKAKALENDLWPLLPRIPVYIELKDYARWFGGRGEDQSVGILAYLAERLTARVDQTVLPGALRRAFAESRWLFVFDGLDEVPSDVKDALSGEVIKFVDDFLIGLSADAVTVCTSRRQGYSGQLDSLEAATVELTLLHPPLALACAMPVLRIDRSVEEARRYEEILREAIQSRAVADIMRTPLQAHIMAVVVRDGGRPPERKWLLFSNFYQVIKKREANRSLLEKKISDLLRVEDKLLKALHNSLGFELHARAEISAGALTSIARPELREMVSKIVAELQATNIEATIETLMTAATDRLVLVNTPDSGDEVRFDIRTLQEFFAAEYVYADVSAEVIGRRLEVIGGDSHWREVVHFLLSALIENSRQTDLTVVIEKIADLNEPVDGAARLFFRRLCLGGAIAARLLSEGVLEQDRRVRHQFRKCLEPIFGATDLELLALLSTVDSRESRNWLIEVAIDALAEYSESECIGAACILYEIVPDGSSCIDQVQRRVEDKSFAFKAALLSISAVRLSGPGSPPGSTRAMPEWAVASIIRMIGAPTWRSLGEDALQGAFEVLAENASHIRPVPGILGDEFAAFLSSALVNEDNDEENRAYKEVKSGVLSIHISAPTDALELVSWTEEQWTGLDGASGVFEQVRRILASACGRAVEPPLQTWELQEALSFLPRSLGAFIPADPLHMSVASEFFAGPGHVMEVRFSAKVDEGALKETASAHPGFIFNYACWGDLERKGWLYGTKEGIETLLKACETAPDDVLSGFGNWGAVLDSAKQLGVDARGALLKTFCAWPRDVYSYMSVDPFALHLPEEANMLPLAMDAISGHIRRRDNFPVGHVPRKSAEELVDAYVSDANSLIALAVDGDVSHEVSAAASMMYLLHPSRDRALDATCLDVIKQNYTGTRGEWYLRSAATALERLVVDDHAPACETLGLLLSKASEDYSSRSAVDHVLNRIRQVSRAPVSRHGISTF